MKGIAAHSDKPTKYMECGRTIPAGMTYRKIMDQRGMRIGDHCYSKCKPLFKRPIVVLTESPMDAVLLNSKDIPAVAIGSGSGCAPLDEEVK